jgi:molecular chaperone HtpG
MLDREVESPKRILELNPKHPFVKNLAALIADHPDSQEVVTFSELLLDQAMLAEGVIPDPSSLLMRIQQVTTAASQQIRDKPKAD